MEYFSKYIETGDITYVWLDVIDYLKKGIEIRINNLIKKRESEGETAIRNPDAKGAAAVNTENEDKEFANSDSSSYELINPYAHLIKMSRLCNGLKKKGFIDKDTKLDDFKAIFIGRAKVPVIWIGSGGLSEILYLFYSLWGEKEESKQYIQKPKQPYKNLKNCFKWQSDKGMANSCRAIYNKIKNSEEFPARAKIIDLLINSLK